MIHEVLEFFAGLKERNFLRRDFHFRAGLGVTAGAAAAFARAEAAKAADLDLIVGLESGNNALKNRFYHRFGFFARQFGDAGDLFDEVGLRHRMIFVFTLSRSLWHRMRPPLTEYEDVKTGEYVTPSTGWGDTVGLCISSIYRKCKRFFLERKAFPGGRPRRPGSKTKTTAAWPLWRHQLWHWATTSPA